MNNLPCEVVRDLFPSYIDKLTDSKTNALLEAHVADCRECADILESMRSLQEEPTVSDEQKKELDFLKKHKRRSLMLVIGGLAAVVCVALFVLGLRVFVIGDYLYGDWIACQVTVSGSSIVLDGTPVDSVHGISKVIFEEKDGVVTATTKAIWVSPLHRDGSFHAVYTAQDKVKQVRLNDRILWYDGAEISSLASAVYDTRHEYMGDMSANARTANALNITQYLGVYQNELHTAMRPYGWTLKLQEDISEGHRTLKESDMESFSCILLAVVGNLDEVYWEYTVEGEPITRTVTKEEASLFFGQDIKDCGRSPRLLNALIDKTGLSTYAFRDDTESAASDAINWRVTNCTDTPWQSILTDVYLDGELRFSGGCLNADESPVTKGQSLYVTILSEEFGRNVENRELTLSLSVITEDGEQHDLPPIRLPSQFGTAGGINVYQNEDGSFTLRQ